MASLGIAVCFCKPYTGGALQNLVFASALPILLVGVPPGQFVYHDEGGFVFWFKINIA